MSNKTQHSNLTRALSDLWAAYLWWSNLVAWRSFGLPGQIVCARTFARKMRNIEAGDVFEFPQEPLDLATISRDVDFFSNRSIEFTEDYDDLDSYLAAFIELESKDRLMLMCRHQHPNLKRQMGVVISPNHKDPFQLLENLRLELNLIPEDIIWSLSPLRETHWKLVTDVAGVGEVIVYRCWSEGTAEGGLRTYKKRFDNCRIELESMGSEQGAPSKTDSRLGDL